MTDELKNLLAKIEKIERQLKEISNIADKYTESSYSVYKTNFLNFSCVETKKLKIAEIKIGQNQNILLDCAIEVLASAEQEVEFTLIVAGMSIVKIRQRVPIGISSVSLSQNCNLLTNSEAEIYLLVKPIGGKQVILQSSVLTVWGAESENQELNYCSLNLDDSYLLAFCKNDNIYYKIITKNAIELNEIDFEFCAKGRDFSFAYDKNKNTLLLCRIDLDGRLFVDDFYTKKSIFIDENVSGISSIFADDKMVIAYIKNQRCFICEFVSEGNFYIEELSYNLIIKNCEIFYNNFNKKFYLVLLKNDGKNIMFESVGESKTLGENIAATYSFAVNVYEVQNEV